MITPVNGHLLIEPLKHESFMASQRETFEEVGTVLAIPKEYMGGLSMRDYGNDLAVEKIPSLVAVGTKVFFDSWLAAKYPKNEDEYYWLVKWEDVRAIEHAEVPK